MKTQKQTAGFSIKTQWDGAYHMLYIKVMADYTESFSAKCAYLKYQANKDTPYQFYGGDLSIESSDMAYLDTVHKFVRGIFKHNTGANFQFYSNALGVIIALQDSKLSQVVNDSRLSKHIPITEVLPESFSAYRDHYKAYGQESCTVGCVAESDDEARRLLTIQFAEQKSSYYSTKCDLWIAAGRPVLKLDSSYSSKMPEFISAQDLITKMATVKDSIAA